MNKQFIDYKVIEYTGRMGSALCRRDHEKAKKEMLTLLCLLRLRSRAAVGKMVSLSDELSALKRSMKKLSQGGVTFPLGEQRIKKLDADRDEARKELAGAGADIASLLDCWQLTGASLVDLCNLCNRDYNQVLEEIKPERIDREFSSLIFVYNLDYKDPRSWIDFEVDAPLTHAVKEYFLDLMINTPEGQEVSHRAMEECFPGIMENALTTVTDEDGTRRLIDKDGVEVAVLDDEEEAWR